MLGLVCSFRYQNNPHQSLFFPSFAIDHISRSVAATREWGQLVLSYEDQADVQNTSTGTGLLHRPHLHLDTDRLCNSRTVRTWLPRIVNIKRGGDIAFRSPPAEHVHLDRMSLQKSMPASSGCLTTLKQSPLYASSSDLRQRDDWTSSIPSTRILEPQTTRKFDFVQAGCLHLVVRTCSSS
jgi:hypothetical protein